MQKKIYAILFGLLFATSTAFGVTTPISLSVSAPGKIISNQVQVSFTIVDSVPNSAITGTVAANGIIHNSFSCTGSVCNGSALVDVTNSGHNKITVTAYDQYNNVVSRTVNVLN